ncbi:hypothetical protein [Streptomyces sp. NPDC000410]|uniref:hypothetical protein n=1 Tax=Streptomyces sp. NPDC000410 TaxID=3154254 RepID=UPI0033339A10
MIRRLTVRTGRGRVRARSILAAVAALPLAVLFPSAGTALADGPGGPDDPGETRVAAGLLSCGTTSDGRTGTANCSNPSSQVVAFRAVVVCGEWPDQVGDWVTLNPGGSGSSSATCSHGTGVGSVSWEEG